nr:hypothetical protein [Tanacetum cinerariifolium]
MKSIQTFLKEFKCIPFEKKPQIFLQAWFSFFAIKHAQPEDSNELFQKLLEDLKELAEYVNSTSRDRPNFFDNNKEHSAQYKENIENSSNSNQEKEGPPQDSDIRQLIKEECYIEVCEDQKQNMENTILELVEICRQKELLCMHDNVYDLIESALNSKLLSINSQLAPILSTKEPEYSPSMGYENPKTTPKTKSDEIIKSGVEELVPILSENEVTSEDKRKCDVPVCENSPICDDHFEIFSDSKNDDEISSDDDDFEDIEYVEASLPDPEVVSLEEENVVYHEEEEVDLEYVFQIQDIVLREKLLSINRLIANIESLNDNPTPDRLLNSSVSFPISEESDNSLSDNFSPEFENFCDHTEETRSEADLFLASDNSIPSGIENFAYDLEGDIRFLEALLIDNSISNFENELSNNESSESDFDNPSFPRPPPEPPDADFEPDSGEEISVAMNDYDELECLDPKDVIDVSTNDDDVYSSFMFVFYSKMFLSFLSTESEDTIFNPGFTPHRLKFLVFRYLSRFARSSHPFFEISLGKSISLISIA